MENILALHTAHLDVSTKKHILNGIVSLVISVAATSAMQSDTDTYTRSDVLIAVGISAFLSGLFASFFGE